LPSITGIELGSDSCVLVRARPRAGRAEVSSFHVIERADWAAHVGNIATELRAQRRSKRFPRHGRVVAWALAEPARRSDPAVRSLLAPLLAAGFRIQHVLTPPEALAEIARTRPQDPGTTGAWMALNAQGAAIAIVRDGLLLFGRTFAWKYSFGAVGPRAEMLQRYSLVSHLAPELRRGIALVRSSHGAIVERAITCGDLPDLRSLTMPLIEELDLEVDTLDSTEGLHAVGRARSDRFAEFAPVLRLATAAATAHVRDGGRTPHVSRILRVAAAAVIITTAGWLAYRYWPEAPARPVADRVATVPLPTPTSGTSPATPPQVRDAVSASGTAAPAITAVPPTTRVSTPETPVAVTPPAPLAPRQSQTPVPPAAASPGVEVAAEAPIATPAPLHSRPSTDPPAVESARARADTSRRKPVPLKDAVPSVDSILISQDRRLAIVEGRILSVGDRVGPRVVVDIERDAVVLQEPSGHQIRILLRPEPGAQWG
jgi:hypothetical protein